MAMISVCGCERRERDGQTDRQTGRQVRNIDKDTGAARVLERKMSNKPIMELFLYMKKIKN
jgi:hypothetical protein